jgi:hypothetical protein
MLEGFPMKQTKVDSKCQTRQINTVNLFVWAEALEQKKHSSYDQNEKLKPRGRVPERHAVLE